jgi:MFS family permease
MPVTTASTVPKDTGGLSYYLLILSCIASLPLYYISPILNRRAAVYDLASLELEVEAYYNITTAQYAYILTAFYLGNILTSMLVTWFAKVIGRRYS